MVVTPASQSKWAYPFLARIAAGIRVGPPAFCNTVAVAKEPPGGTQYGEGDYAYGAGYCACINVDPRAARSRRRLRTIFEDPGLSGGKPLGSRSAGGRLLAKARRTKSVLVVARLDRLFRSVADGAHNIIISTATGSNSQPLIRSHRGIGASSQTADSAIDENSVVPVDTRVPSRPRGIADFS
jgi:hypothetical protein